MVFGRLFQCGRGCSTAGPAGLNLEIRAIEGENQIAQVMNATELIGIETLRLAKSQA
jgi:hypothetical protein